MCMAAVAMVGLAVSNDAQGQTVATGQRIEVAQSTAERLSKALPIVGDAPATLSKDAENLLVHLLPESTRKLCGDLVERWGPGRNEALLSVRWLHAHRERNQLSALLTYRCAFRSNGHFDPVFDEWPALLVGSANRYSLSLISSYKPEVCCDPHSVEFLKSLPLTDGQLLELGIQSSSYGDGADSSSSYELVWVSDPAGNVALKVDSRTEFNGYDADTEESHERVCDAQVRYEKDGMGKLTAIMVDTGCIEDKVKKPSETVRYVWDAPAGRFKGANLQNAREAAGR